MANIFHQDFRDFPCASNEAEVRNMFVEDIQWFYTDIPELPEKWIYE
jgi:hypothetical protein